MVSLWGFSGFQHSHSDMFQGLGAFGTCGRPTSKRNLSPSKSSILDPIGPTTIPLHTLKASKGEAEAWTPLSPVSGCALSPRSLQSWCFVLRSHNLD